MELDLGEVLDQIKKRWDVVVLIGIGIVMLLLGVSEYTSSKQSDDLIEIIESGSSEEVVGSVVIDVSGAVERPGIYRLELGARVNQAIEAAGGFSEDADELWVASQLNLASQINDGSKIFIPPRSSQSNSAPDLQTSQIQMQSGKINVNTASLEQLRSLTGVGEVRANNILENRPYADLMELQHKAGLSQRIIDDNADKIVFY